MKDLSKQNAGRNQKTQMDRNSSDSEATNDIPNQNIDSALSSPHKHVSTQKPPWKEAQTRTEAPPPSETDPPDLKVPPVDPEAPQRRILPYNFEYYSRSFRQLAMSLPQLHRPTQEDFLRVADGFWQRLRIRFKWFTIKSFRKFNADDISGIMTWVLMSQTIWILVGTYVLI